MSAALPWLVGFLLGLLAGAAAGALAGVGYGVLKGSGVRFGAPPRAKTLEADTAEARAMDAISRESKQRLATAIMEGSGCSQSVADAEAERMIAAGFGLGVDSW